VGALHHLVADHVVQARIIFPGAGYLELARAAQCGITSTTVGPTLSSVFFLQALAVEVAGLHVECAISEGRFEVRSGEESSGVPLDTTAHCTGVVTAAAQDLPVRIDHAVTRAHHYAHMVDVKALYVHFDAIGLQYGPRYRALARAWSSVTSDSRQGQEEGRRQGSVARLVRHGKSHRVGVPPADLDGAIQLGIVQNPGEMRLPFAVDSAVLHNGMTDLWAVCAPLFATRASH
jgi:hypothetical protein